LKDKGIVMQQECRVAEIFLKQKSAYTHFIAHLVSLAKNLKRVNATAKEAENEKYAFRCFLLRLGFIGDEYKEVRKVLLKNLAGQSAFKGVKQNIDKAVDVDE
jgi:flagellar motor component MotA